MFCRSYSDATITPIAAYSGGSASGSHCNSGDKGYIW
jgi:hypothetical protein